uniref:DNA-directed RNA polymerase II RPB9 n=1 Tax=Toxoplasma gondii TgCATBr9 TaxID=943120 RepID=A0A2T6IVU2_TOXGO|nr:DNA-directed RNA polymerase II RPB9 [Toxoplasma gondii TgCATBr9]
MMGKSMMFCPECNNMLYPREDKEKRQLQFLCRQCDYSRYPKKTDTAQHIVERTNFNFKSKEDIVISSDLSKDPTLGRVFDWRCPRCRGVGGVFYQLPERVAEDAMTLVYVCTQPGCGAWEIQQPDGQGTGEDGRREKEDDSLSSPSEPRGAAFRLHEAKVEEDESSVAGALEAGALSVKRAAAEAQDEDREAEFGDAPLGGEVEEDDDLFGEREEEEILESQDAFDEDDPYTHRLEPQDGSVGELDVTFD